MIGRASKRTRVRLNKDIYINSFYNAKLGFGIKLNNVDIELDKESLKEFCENTLELIESIGHVDIISFMERISLSYIDD